MEEFQIKILDHTCTLIRHRNELWINFPYSDNQELTDLAKEEAKQGRLVSHAWDLHICLRSTYFKKGAMFGTIWEKWSLEGIESWLQRYFQDLIDSAENPGVG